jgi:hypothetical protein
MVVVHCSLIFVKTQKKLKRVIEGRGDLDQVREGSAGGREKVIKGSSESKFMRLIAKITEFIPSRG